MKTFCKYSILFLFVLFLVSCNNLKPTNNQSLPLNSRVDSIELADTLGKAIFSIPLRYDTSVSWIDYTDNAPDDRQKYRFQPKELRITKESGFLWLGEPTDSIERFTITCATHDGMLRKYPPDPDELKSDSIHFLRYIAARKQFLLRNKVFSPVLDTIEKIGNRVFLINASSSISDNNKLEAIVHAETKIKNNYVYFDYQLLTSHTDSVSKNFITNSLDLIKTIRVSE
ncbi:MAG TPA: hypothetical protein VK718_04355 [Ferruginibacter sp.]|jgi:hypothetical protein|nr:hypothetical protein [Ferruginibacter sp.]